MLKGIRAVLLNVMMSVENRYYSFLDFMRDHHIPVYRIAYWLEERGIPSLYVLVFALLLVGGLFVYFNLRTYELTVYGPAGSPLPKFPLIVDGVQLVTDSAGRITLKDIPESVEVPIEGVMTEYDPKTLTVSLRPIVKELAIIVLPDTVRNPILEVSGMDVNTFEGRFVVLKLATVPAPDAIQVNPDGSFTITVAADGYRPIVRNVNWSSLPPRSEMHITLAETSSPRSEIHVHVVPSVDGYVVLLKGGIETGYKAIVRKGYAVVRNVPFGQYTLRVVPFVDGEEYFDGSGRNDKEILVDSRREDVNIRIYIPAARKLTEIYVYDSESGDPIPGASVRLDNALVGSTDASGVARILLDANKGVALRVDAEGYNGKVIEVRAGERVSVGLEKIGATGALVVHVYDHVGLPVEGARVVVYQDGGKQLEGITDNNGVTELRGLSPGQWTIKALSPDESKIAIENITLGKGERKSVNIEISPTVSVTVVTVVKTDDGDLVGVPAKVSVVMADTRRTFEEGETDHTGRISFELPEYVAVVFVAQVTLRGVSHTYISAPEIVRDGMVVTINFSEEDDSFVTFLSTDFIPVLAVDVNRPYYAVLRVRCENDCFKEIKEEGIKITGLLPIGISANLARLEGKKGLLVDCSGICTYNIPLIVEAVAEGCHTVQVGNIYFSVPSGQEVPECDSQVCVNTDVPDVVRANTPEPFALAFFAKGIRDENVDVNIQHSTNVAVSAVHRFSCSTSKGMFFVESGIFGAYSPGSEQMAARITAGQYTAEEDIPFTVLPSDVPLPELKGDSFFVAFRNCDSSLTVWADTNSQAKILYTVIMGDKTRSALLEGSEHLTLSVPKDVDYVLVRAEGVDFLPIEKNIPRRYWISIGGVPSVSLTDPSSTRCDKVPVAVDANIAAIFGGRYGRPNVDLFYKVWSESNQLVARTWQDLKVKDTIITPETKDLTVCASVLPGYIDEETGLVTGESMNWRIMYRLVADRSITVGSKSCNPVSGWNVAFLDAEGEGKCLVLVVSSTSDARGIVSLDERFERKIYITLINNCAESSVQADILISGPEGVEFEQEHHLVLAPLERKKLEVGLKVSDPEALLRDAPVGVFTINVVYHAEGYPEWTLDDEVPYVYEHLDRCFSPVISYDPVAGVLIDLNSSCENVEACPTAISINGNTVGRIDNCEMFTRNLPSDRIIPLLAGIWNAHATIRMDIVAKWPERDITKVIPSREVPASIQTTDLNKMVFLVSGCRVRNDTPFSPGIKVFSGSAARSVLIPPKTTVQPPLDGFSIDLCSGSATGKVYAMFGAKDVLLGACDVNIANTRPQMLVTSVAGIVNFDKTFSGTYIQYTPTADPPAYAIIDGNLHYYGPPYEFTCVSAPCDHMRVCTEVGYWVARAKKGDTIKFRLATSRKNSIFGLLHCDNERRYLPDKTFYVVTPHDLGGGKYTITITHTDPLGQMHEKFEQNVYVLYEYAPESISLGCYVVDLEVFDVNEDGKFVRVKCRYDNNLSKLREFVSNDWQLYREILRALVIPSDSDPLRGTALDRYPLLAIADKNSVSAYRGSKVIPVADPQGVVPLYVFGIGPVSSAQLKGSCEPTIPLWTLEKQLSRNVSPFYSASSILLIRENNTHMPVGITTVGTWESVVGPLILQHSEGG